MKPQRIHTMKKYTIGLIEILGVILALAIASSPAFGQGEKVSERTALASGSLAPATDILPIVDISAGAAGSKKIVINDLFTGWGFTTAGADMAQAANVAAQRTLLGMGTAALLDHGTANGNLVRLDVTTGKLPAVDGSLLTSIALDNIIPPTGATGDMYYRNSSSVLTKLAAGSDGQVLKLASGLPSWAADSAGTTLTDSASLRTALSDETGSGLAVFATSPTLTTPVINLGSDATGDVYYRNSGGTLSRLAVGTNGHVLKLASGLPSWAADSGTVLTDSASLRTALSDETGTGWAVFANSPSIVTPAIASPSFTGTTTLAGIIEGVVSMGTVTTSHTIDITNGTRYRVRLTASTACTFTMPTATDGKSFTLEVEQAAATGNGTATFTSVDWGTAGAPTITATAGKMDIITFMANGSKWFGSYAKGYTY